MQQWFSDPSKTSSGERSRLIITDNNYTAKKKVLSIKYCTGDESHWIKYWRKQEKAIVNISKR
jgi:hypothetical protein